MTTATVANGVTVRYHGSLKHYHGMMMTVEGTHKERVDTGGEYSPIRYILRYGPKLSQYLENVRPESFTVLREPGLTEEDETMVIVDGGPHTL